MTKAEHLAAIAVLEAQLGELAVSPVSEYQLDNAGQRQGVKYRTVGEIEAQIRYHRKEIARLSKGRALAVFRK